MDAYKQRRLSSIRWWRGIRSNIGYTVKNSDFLQQNAITWEYIPSYKAIQNVIEQTIIVINDGAERFLGIAEKSINSQRARKEKYFKNLVCTKFDKNERVME